jgi:hypothetical protein
VIATATIDTWADQGSQAKNHGTAAKLHLNGGGTARYAYIFFAAPFPPGVQVDLATLRVYTVGTPDWNGQTITAKRIEASWKEDKLTWNNKPAVSATNASSEGPISAGNGQEVEIDLTAMLADVAAGAPFFGVRLEIGTNVDRSVHSAEASTAAYRPALEVEWSEPSDAPNLVAPTGARVISLAKPRLIWEPSEDEQVASQVQIDNTDDMASPEYDSGEQANTESEWDLAPTAYAGVPDGQTRFWRARVKNPSGEWSEWSDVAEFSRQTWAALAITNPQASPNNQVEETTPPITHTYGGTQTQVRRILFELDAPGNPPGSRSSRSVDSWAVDASTSKNLSAGLLKQGRSYEIWVYIRDDEDRQAMPGDPDYLLATRAFTFVPGGPTAPTALTATPDKAAVKLNVQRASAPDYWAVLKDGEEVADRIDPDDVFVSAGVWEITRWDAIPGTEHEWEVAAVVDNAGVLEHSTSNPTDTATTEPETAYLVDPDDDTVVEIWGHESLEPMQIGASGTTHYPIGSRRPVSQIDAIRGYEAGISSGELLTNADRDDFLELKGRQQPLRLIFSDYNLPVELNPEGSSVTPKPIPGEEFDISFAWAQVDEFTFAVAGE